MRKCELADAQIIRAILCKQIALSSSPILLLSLFRRKEEIGMEEVECIIVMLIRSAYCFGFIQVSDSMQHYVTFRPINPFPSLPIEYKT